MTQLVSAVGSAKLFPFGAHGTQLSAPPVDEAGAEWIHDVCDRFWSYRSADCGPDITVPRAETQWRENCALARSNAASLMLGYRTPPRSYGRRTRRNRGGISQSA